MTGDLGTLNPGAISSFTITVDATTPGTFCNTVQVSAAEPESDTTNNSASVCHSVSGAVGKANLTVTKTVAPDPVKTGQHLTYIITVTNDGPDTATGVAVPDVLPPGVSLMSVVPSQGSCTGTSVATYDLGTLLKNASATVIIVVQP